MAKYTVKIKVHPIVFRYFENTFLKAAGVYDLRKHPYYTFISMGLSRHNVTVPSCLSLRYGKMTEIEVGITSWDYHHYGDRISPVHQVAFSQFVQRQIIDNACYKILVAHVFAGIARDTAIKNYLLENLYYEEELNYPALRKHYQRHWIATEKEFKEQLDEMSTKITRNPQLINTNKNVGFVPFKR